MQSNIIGIDLAKNTFSVCVMNSRGKVASRKKFNRQKLMSYLADLDKSFIAMEACGGAHYWARVARDHGHDVKLISPQYVKPFVKTNKNDNTDAEAICEAASRESIPSVPIKETWQQDLLAIHRIKERLTTGLVALTNEIHGLLLEYGIVAPVGRRGLKRKVSDLVDSNDSPLSELFRRQLARLLAEMKDMETRLNEIKNEINTYAKSNETCQRLETVPGVGPMISTAMVAAVGNGSDFKNGRHMAAWIGLVPRHSGTGGVNRVGRLSKRGDRYLRKILIQGAQSVVRWASNSQECQRKWIDERLRKKHRNHVVVAIANKNTRIIWKLLTTNESFKLSSAYNV